MTFYITGNRWTLCRIISKIGSIATVRLYNHLTGECDGDQKTGKAKQTGEGVLVYA